MLEAEPDAEGFVDLFDVVEAARAATGYPMQPPDEHRDWALWVADERAAARQRFEALMAGWHGLPLNAVDMFVPDETIVLAGADDTSLVAYIVRTPRGHWLWGLRTGVGGATGGVPLGPAVTQAYATRATALEDAAREAYAHVRRAAPRYVRILASLRRQANLPSTRP